MKEFLLIGWGVVASLGVLLMRKALVKARSDARCWRDACHVARAETWNVRAECYEKIRQLTERYYTTPPSSTASVNED